MKKYININKEKGITLISLIVTITILLILVGVTVYILTGDNGLLRNARDAKKTNQNEETEFTEEMSNIYIKWDEYDKNMMNITDY